MPRGQGIGLNNMQTAWFTGQSGSGSAQSIPHLMNATPALVLLSVKDSSKSYTIGTSTTTNIVVTVENGAAYDVVAFFSRD